MFSVHAAATLGYAIYFAESIERVPDNVRSVQPTIFFGVPRIWEKFHTGVSGKYANHQSLSSRNILEILIQICDDVSFERLHLPAEPEQLLKPRADCFFRHYFLSF
jgi:long-subunit acyl-CoA synthetase (AMP-forming)